MVDFSVREIMKADNGESRVAGCHNEGLRKINLQ
jgi:hypothetical protein